MASTSRTEANACQSRRLAERRVRNDRLTLGRDTRASTPEPKQETVMLECVDYARCLSQSSRMLGVADGASGVKVRCLDRLLCSFRFSVRANGAVSVHLACMPKNGGRIDEWALVATGRDYHTAHASYIVPKSGGRTKRVLCVFVAARLARRTSDSESCRSAV